MTRVRAAVFRGDGTVELRELPAPAPPAGGAVLAVEAVGLCGTDLAQFHGELHLPGARFPIVPGHEVVGRISAIAADTAAAWGVREGDRVAVDEVLRCGRCAGCRRFEPACSAVGVYGITFGLDEAPGLWGGCAEAMVLKPGTIVHRIDGDVAAEELTLFEPLANAIHWLDVVGLRPGETVVVQGPGHIGLACVVAALAAGAATVIVTGTGRDAARLAAARALGAQHTVDVDAEDAVARVREITGGALADVVLDVADGATATIPLAVELARPRGRIALAGFKHGQAVSGLVSDRLILKKLTLQGVGGATSAAMRTAVALLAGRRAEVAALRGEILPFDRIPDAMALLARRVPGRDAVRVGLRIAA
ncbi:MAG TPA: zinc-binding dehydrogenase [Candidatus Dormibacteraeota bacterium]|nr:zinc-binding dehydrogenase [Candidatus Dormibacteraeota bacterium]